MPTTPPTATAAPSQSAFSTICPISPSFKPTSDDNLSDALIATLDAVVAAAAAPSATSPVPPVATPIAIPAATVAAPLTTSPPNCWDSL